MTVQDPYRTLGVSPTATDAEIRAAYRRLVKLTHPDHNAGSEESEQRFEEVQEAYARIRELRAGGATGRGSGGPSRPGGTASRPGGTASRPGGTASRPGASTAGRRSSRPQPPPPPAADPEVEERMANIERELRQAHEARERARRAAAKAAAANYERPSDEDLGYVTTDDSFSKILSDARSEISARLSDAREEAREHPVTKRVSDLIDDLERFISHPTDRPK